MIYIYNAIILGLLIYMVLKKRRPDFLDVYAVSSILYYLPLSMGILSDEVYNGSTLISERIKIPSSLYLFGICNFLVLLLWMLIKDNTNNFRYKIDNIQETEMDKNNNKIIFILSIILWGCIVCSIAKNASALFSGNFNKVVFIQNVGMLETICRYLGLFVGTYSFTRNKYSKFQIITSVTYIVYSLLMGRRSDFVLLVIMTFVFKMITSTREEHNLIFYFKEHKREFIFIAIVGVLVMPVKRSLPAFINGDIIGGFQYTIKCMFDSATYLNSESNSITLYVHKVIESNDILYFRPYLFDLLSIIPFGNMLTNNWIYENGFDVYFQEKYFPSITADVAGLAGSFWSENFANWGWIGMILSMNLLFYLLCRLEVKIIDSRKSVYMPFLLIIMIHLSFYIHRLFFSHIINVIKYLFCIVLLVYMVSFLRQNIRIKRIGS